MGATFHFCTYFDSRYLSRGLALYSSLRRCCSSFELFVLCLTAECHSALESLALPNLTALRLEDLEAYDPELCRVKKQRAEIEYYFTCGPALMAWLLERDPAIEVLTYLDADLYFYQDPKPIFDAFEGFSTLIVPHNFSAGNERERIFGLYNVGWISFRADEDGFACLRWWRRSCLEWCRDVPEEGRYADQKYLEQFPAKFARVQITDHPGINLAPWNIDNYRFVVGPDKQLFVDDRPVIFFHFHGLRRVTSFLWYTTHVYGVPPSRKMKAALYAPYLADLNFLDNFVRHLLSARQAPLERHTDRPRLGNFFARIQGALVALSRGGAIWILKNRVSRGSPIAPPANQPGSEAGEPWRTRTRRPLSQ
jgi:hypothetical protein